MLKSAPPDKLSPKWGYTSHRTISSQLLAWAWVLQVWVYLPALLPPPDCSKLWRTTYYISVICRSAWLGLWMFCLLLGPIPVLFFFLDSCLKVSLFYFFDSWMIALILWSQNEKQLTYTKYFKKITFPINCNSHLKNAITSIMGGKVFHQTVSIKWLMLC